MLDLQGKRAHAFVVGAWDVQALGREVSLSFGMESAASTISFSIGWSRHPLRAQSSVPAPEERLQPSCSMRSPTFFLTGMKERRTSTWPMVSSFRHMRLRVLAGNGAMVLPIPENWDQFIVRDPYLGAE